MTARLTALVMVALVAVAGTTASALTAQSIPARVLAGAAALGAGALPLLRPRWSGSALQNWTRARSVSEGLKSEVYLWLAHAGPYRADAGEDLLRSRTEAVLAHGADLLRWQLGLAPGVRDLPPVHDPASYFVVRVGQQIEEYYRPRARRLAEVVTRFRRLELALSLIAAGVAAYAAAADTSLAPWIAAVTTVGTAVATHVAASRFEYQLIEYLRTAAELDRLRGRAEATSDPDELAALVAAAESVISVENQAWMAKLAEDIPDHH